jgi:UDP-N-acetylglucosamine diphosphorylase/glucosamine-1-phosphate N-acetyltransferase
MQIIFEDNGLHLSLAPVTLTKPVAEIRVGILTIKESWLHYLEKNFETIDVRYETAPHLNVKFPAPISSEGIRIMGNIKPSQTIVQAVLDLPGNATLVVNAETVAIKGNGEQKHVLLESELVCIKRPWDIFQQNGLAIQLDYDYLTQNRISAPLSATNRVSGIGHVFIEEGAKIEHAILNAEAGPIYIGKNATIMEGSLIRGPFALCDDASIKMGAKIYGPTTVGPHCKVGGEVNNSVFQAYSNKGHDGFLGNSIIGEWCNLGADTNSSNLKNNYGFVKIYDYETQKLEPTKLQFCGLIMGDHSKSGINTMFNTATTVGVSANVFGAGFPSKYIPSFTWGGAEQSEQFILEKAFEVAENMMARRKVPFTEADRSILSYLYNGLA